MEAVADVLTLRIGCFKRLCFLNRLILRWAVHGGLAGAASAACMPDSPWRTLPVETCIMGLAIVAFYREVQLDGAEVMARRDGGVH